MPYINSITGCTLSAGLNLTGCTKDNVGGIDKHVISLKDDLNEDVQIACYSLHALI